MDAKPHGEPAAPAAGSIVSRYQGPKDIGRAESLYRSALEKPDLDYSAQLLFSALVANPEHEGSFRSILSKIPAFGAAGRKMAVRIAELLGGGPADAFVKALAAFCAAPTAENALACAAEAHRVGLLPYAVALGERVLRQAEAGDNPPKAGAVARLIDLFESCGALEQAVRAARAATRLFPDEQAFRGREKNLMASRYLKDTDLTSPAGFRATLKDRQRQEAMQRPADHAARLDELEHRYRQTHSLDDFREFTRALREAAAPRREAAVPTLEDGLQRFGERDTRWFIREIQLERKWAELRVHRRVLDESPASGQLREEHESLRREVLREHVDHLYEVVGSLPNTPERQRRELELAGKLFDASRYEEAIKQAQAVKRRSESRLDALVVMAKSFVQLGLTPEATECFQSILAELAANPQGSLERVLEAKYSYAQFLLAEAENKHDAVLARQARKLCSDVMIEDIDYRDVRALSQRADAIL